MWALCLYTAVSFLVLQSIWAGNDTTTEGVNKDKSYKETVEEVLGRNINNLVPPLSGSTKHGSVAVEVDFHVHRIISLNSESATLTVSGKLRMAWTDDRYSWIAGPEALFLKSDAIWTPEWTLLTSLDIDSDTGPRVLIMRSGRAAMEKTMMVGVACDVNMRLFPHDLQMCYLNFTPVLSQRHVISPTTTESSCRFDEVLSEEWSLRSCSRSIRSISLQNIFGQPDQVATFSINLALVRNSGFYVLTIIIPTIMLALVTLVPFMLPPSLSAQKIVIPITTYLSFNVYMILLEKSLPKSRQTPILGQIVAVFMAVCVFTEICQAVSVKFYSCRIQNVPEPLAFVYFRIFAVISCFETCHGATYRQSYEDNLSGITRVNKGTSQKAWLSMGRINDRIGLLISSIIVGIAMLFFFISCF